MHKRDIQAHLIAREYEQLSTWRNSVVRMGYRFDSASGVHIEELGERVRHQR